MTAAQVYDMNPDPRHVSVVTIDPATAERMLGRNTRNRNIRQAQVDALARDMAAGKFMINGESIKFAPDGTLLDGQHRLAAVVQSGATIQTVVAYGVDPQAMKTIDTGRKRSYADVLHMRGEDNAKTLASVLRRIAMWEEGFRVNSGSLTPTPDEMDDLLEAAPEIRASANIAQKLGTRAMLPSSVVGLCHYLFSAFDADGATWFLSRVYDGDSIPASSPIFALRKRIGEMRLAGGRVHETEALALTIRAWNAWRAGETRTKLQMPRGGLTTENFPEPR